MIAADALCRVRDRPGVWVVGDAGSYPGPDWLAEQAHQADLQAKAVAANIAATASQRVPHDLICIVDTLEVGNPRVPHSLVQFRHPQTVFCRWAKRHSNADTLTPIASGRPPNDRHPEAHR